MKPWKTTLRVMCYTVRARTVVSHTIVSVSALALPSQLVSRSILDGAEGKEGGQQRKTRACGT